MKDFIEKGILKINYSAIVLVVITLSIFHSMIASADIRFNSERIKQVFTMLPNEYKGLIETNCAIDSSGSHFLDISLNGGKNILVYRYNKYQELDHIGLYLVSDNPDFTKIREVFDYFEREFLVSALLNLKYPLIQITSNKKIEILFNGSSIKEKKSLSILPKLLINKDTPFKISYDSNYFVIKWNIESSNVFEVRIPNNYTLITEKTKDELELELLRKLQTPQEGNFSIKRPEKSQLKLCEPNIYFYKGDIYSNNEGLSSTKYFEIKDSINPVFNTIYYKESISNLFLNEIPSQIILGITQKLYGGSEEKFRINLNSFFRNFGSDYKIYFGWQSDDKENIKASIIISNTVFNYTHLLEISTDYKTIFKENGEVNAMFFAYTPKENHK